MKIYFYQRAVILAVLFISLFCSMGCRNSGGKISGMWSSPSVSNSGTIFRRAAMREKSGGSEILFYDDGKFQWVNQAGTHVISGIYWIENGTLVLYDSWSKEAVKVRYDIRDGVMVLHTIRGRIFEFRKIR